MHFVLLEFRIYAMIVSAHSMHVYTEPVFLCTFIVYIYYNQNNNNNEIEMPLYWLAITTQPLCQSTKRYTL